MSRPILLLFAFVFGGLVAWLWILLWGLSVSYIALPLLARYQYFLERAPHADATIFFLRAFDTIFSMAVALLFVTPATRFIPGGKTAAWAAFIGGAALTIFVPVLWDENRYDLALFILMQPMLWAFIFASAAGCWLGTPSQRRLNVEP